MSVWLINEPLVQPRRARTRARTGRGFRTSRSNLTNGNAGQREDVRRDEVSLYQPWRAVLATL